MQVDVKWCHLADCWIAFHEKAKQTILPLKTYFGNDPSCPQEHIFAGDVLYGSKGQGPNNPAELK